MFICIFLIILFILYLIHRYIYVEGFNIGIEDENKFINISKGLSLLNKCDIPKPISGNGKCYCKMKDPSHLGKCLGHNTVNGVWSTIYRGLLHDETKCTSRDTLDKCEVIDGNSNSGPDIDYAKEQDLCKWCPPDTVYNQDSGECEDPLLSLTSCVDLNRKTIYSCNTILPLGEQTDETCNRYNDINGYMCKLEPHGTGKCIAKTGVTTSIRCNNENENCAYLNRKITSSCKNVEPRKWYPSSEQCSKYYDTYGNICFESYPGATKCSTGIKTNVNGNIGIPVKCKFENCADWGRTKLPIKNCALGPPGKQTEETCSLYYDIDGNICELAPFGTGKCRAKKEDVTGRPIKCKNP